MNKVAAEYKEKYNLNYSVLATPAEGLSGRFTRMDRSKYGKIPGVTDSDYYVNSFHVDVKEPISIVEKIKREAPFHAITGGGHITYVELDGEAQKNVRAIAKIVKVMHDEGIGYGSINHPVDTCHNCGYKGVIFDKCPYARAKVFSAYAPHHRLSDRRPQLLELRQTGGRKRPKTLVKNKRVEE